jgi:anion-transporting  ArsA/GET3 family ATPase
VEYTPISAAEKRKEVKFLKDPLEGLAKRQLVVVTGKGGVGKSTITAALGSALSRRGKRILLLEIDPRESIYQLLGISPSGGEVVQAAPRLFVQNLRPRAVLDRMVRDHLHIDLLSDRLLASPLYRHFVEGAPGLKEMAIIEHATRMARKNFDLVILDAPATGHGLALLSAPSVVSEVIHDGPVGHLGKKLAKVVADPRTCGIILVTAAEEMPAQEAIEFLGTLQEQLSRRPELMVVNNLYPDEPGLLGERRQVNEKELRRLRDAWQGRLVELPMMPLDSGPSLITALEQSLRGR